MSNKKKDLLAAVIGQMRSFRFSSPSDDPDEVTAAVTGYRHLLVQLKRLAAPLLPEAEAARLNAIEVDHGNILGAFDACSEVDTLLPDIEAALERADDAASSLRTSAWMVNPELIKRLEGAQSAELLVRLCQEINSCFANGNIVATALLMRTVLNYVPPCFGHEKFEQVVANVGRSLKDSFGHLENGIRKIADVHAHRPHRPGQMYPSAAQVEPFKAQFELLLQEVVSRLTVG